MPVTVHHQRTAPDGTGLWPMSTTHENGAAADRDLNGDLVISDRAGTKLAGYHRDRVTDWTIDPGPVTTIRDTDGDTPADADTPAEWLRANRITFFGPPLAGFHELTEDPTPDEAGEAGEDEAMISLVDKMLGLMERRAQRLGITPPTGAAANCAGTCCGGA